MITAVKWLYFNYISYIYATQNYCFLNKYISECGLLYTWGCNTYGQLCFKDRISRDKPTLVTNFTNYKIMQLQCGAWNTAVVCEDI